MRAVPPSAVTRRAGLPPIAADVAAVLVFVLVGRSSHAEHDTLAGIAKTAWPFLAGLALGWVVARGWRTPSAVRPGAMRAGLVIWPVTVLVGHALRLASGQGSAWSFLVVTTVVLGAFLLGWRLLVGALNRRPAWTPRNRRATGTDPSR